MPGCGYLAGSQLKVGILAVVIGVAKVHGQSFGRQPGDFDLGPLASATPAFSKVNPLPWNDTVCRSLVSVLWMATLRRSACSGKVAFMPTS